MLTVKIFLFTENKRKKKNTPLYEMFPFLMNNNFFQILFCMVFFFHQFLYIALCLLIFFPYSFQLRLILLTLLCGICLHFAPYLRPRLLRLTLLFQQLHLMAVSILFCLILQPANLLL